MPMDIIWPHLTFGNAQKPPIIFLHGFMGRGEDWRAVCEMLAGDFYCLAPDLPGHGENTKLPLDAPIIFNDLAKGVLTLLDVYALPLAALVGYSMGGRVALHTIIKHPARFRALVLESASPGLKEEKERQERLEIDGMRAKNILQNGLPSFLEKWYQAEVFASLQSRPKILDSIKTARRQNEAAWMAKIIIDLSPGQQQPLWEELPNLALPSLILAGELDEKYSQIATKTAGAVVNAQLQLIPETGHNIHTEEAGVFVKEVEVFLKRTNEVHPNFCTTQN